MINFCECGSMILNSSCTNRKCKNNIESNWSASFYQIDFIKKLIVLNREEEEQYNLKDLTKLEANILIKQLQESIEKGD